jgi:DNA invertase Pin-like site-specific DNA recombinase
MKAQQKQPVRAACYCRISSDPKDKREGVDRQREDTSALCELKGWKVAGVYIDNDRSASNGKNRPEWERLLADIQAGKIDAVAAWDQDRVNRMMEDFVHYKKLFVERGILLATSNNGDIDLSTPSGVLTATIKTAVSEHEVAMMRIRMKRAARQRAEQGIPKWRRAFGYILGEHQEDCPPTCNSLHHQPDPQTAPLVAEAYAAVLAGGSITDVARAWNAVGAYGLTGKPWSASTVSLFMRKPRNAGLRAHNGEIVGKGTWPALVGESTWRAAQAVLDAPGRAPGRKTVRRHLLTGVLQCGKEGCDGYLSGQWTIQRSTSTGSPAIAYSCKQCRGVSIRAEHVEPLIVGVIAGRLAKPDAVDLLKAELHDGAEAEALRVEANALLARLDEIADERADGLLTGRQAQRATERINEKLAAIERRQQDQERLRVFDGIPLGRPEVADAIKRLSPDRVRAVLDVLATVTVAPVGKGGHVFNPERVQVVWR